MTARWLRMMRRIMLRMMPAMALLLGVLAAPFAAPATAAAQGGGYTVPATGGVDGFAREEASFAGSLSIAGFGAQGSDLLLQGMLDGVIRDASLSPIGNVKLRVATPVADIQADCDGILLILAPLDPDVAGYPLVLDAIRIKAGDLGATTKAQTELLCNAGRLSDRNLSPAVVAQLLNQLMAAFGKK